MRVEQMYIRLREEFPDFTPEVAWGHAERITAVAEQMAFQLDVERDIAALPLTTDRRVA